LVASSIKQGQAHFNPPGDAEYLHTRPFYDKLGRFLGP
jgi:hypothetical protein